MQSFSFISRIWCKTKQWYGLKIGISLTQFVIVTFFCFIFTKEQLEIQQLARKFTKDEITPKAAYYDKTGEFPYDIVKKAHSVGLMNATLPQEYGELSIWWNFTSLRLKTLRMILGGIGLNVLDACLIVEEMSFGCSGIQVAVLSSGLAQSTLILAGNEQQKKKYLGRLTEEPLLAVRWIRAWNRTRVTFCLILGICCYRTWSRIRRKWGQDKSWEERRWVGD